MFNAACWFANKKAQIVCRLVPLRLSRFMVRGGSSSAVAVLPDRKCLKTWLGPGRSYFLSHFLPPFPRRRRRRRRSSAGPVVMVNGGTIIVGVISESYALKRGRGMESQSRGKEEICAFATFEVFSRDIYFFLF